MTDLQAVALSLAPSLSRLGLTARLQEDDPELIELAARYAETAVRVRHEAALTDIVAVPWNAPTFPQLLVSTPDCPPALWLRGSLSTFDRPCIAIVGSRAATPVARDVAATIASDLAAMGLVVVSGLARGVDSAAHRGALTRGETIAVLGSGPDRIYPAEHVQLARDISACGVVLAEYPPGSPPLPFHFPQRNRLISGLSRAVVVIEAAEGSGSLITASCALEQGREVLVVPGNVLTGRNRGGHALIRDGAKLVEGAEDIVRELGLPTDLPRGSDAGIGQTRPPDAVLAAMDEAETYDLDALTAILGIPGPRLLARLLELEIRGLVRRVGGGRFIRPGRTC